MKIRSLLALAAFVAGLPALAQTTADQVKEALRKKFPEASVEEVRKTPYGNLYEVLAGGEILYTDEKTSFLLIGSLVDTKTKENVTELRMRKINAIDFGSLPLESAIKIVRGNGKRKIAVFEDPNCTYCKRFERDLQKVSDITVYVLLYPILSPDSVEKSKAVWCAPDRAKAWMDLMTKDIVPPTPAKCDAPLDKILALGRDKRVQGTPTIIFEDGDRVPGAIPMDQFEKKLASVTAKASASAK